MLTLATALMLVGVTPADAYRDGHRRERGGEQCSADDDWGGCGSGNYGRDQGGGNGNKGRDGDDQRGDKNCHSFCGNTIIVPTPPGMGGGRDQNPSSR